MRNQKYLPFAASMFALLMLAGAASAQLGNTATGTGALSSNTTGRDNTADGYDALQSNQSGGVNTAVGAEALQTNKTGYGNSAFGFVALYLSTGGYNTAVGDGALEVNQQGNYNTAVGTSSGLNIAGGNSNTFIGYRSGYTSKQTNLFNAAAIGALAEVDQNNSLVLGSISGVNGATADTAVGIGTTTPLNTPLGGNPPTKLNIVGNNTFVPLVVQSPSTFGTWMVLNNTSSGGKTWAILSAASGNGERAGNLGITDFGAGGTIILESNVQVTGNLSKQSGQFKIDDPVDPANKYLSHSFVESPDMMNIYNGVIRLDARGAAWITLPDYFEALNCDFRYQLTSLEKPQPNLYVATEISGNRFRISGGKPGGKVSWQVTGIRHDAWANAHRIAVEEDKPQQERGKYFNPELFGAPPENRIGAIPVGASPAISGDTRAEASRSAVPQEQGSRD